MRQEAVQDVLQRFVPELSSCLTDQGTRDLSETRLADLEDELCDLGDQLVRQLVVALLQRQAAQVCGEADCPLCNGVLDEKPDETTPLMTRRGQVHWKQPVRRCEACRRDFFPSGESSGL